MAGPPLVYTPPNYTTTNVLYGTGILFTAVPGTALPSDQNLGVGTAWTGLGWAYVGATEAGVTVTFNPSTQNINIEEQPTPVAVAVNTADLQVTCSLSEETLANVNLSWGNGGTIAVTPPGAGEPHRHQRGPGADRLPARCPAAALPADPVGNLPVQPDHLVRFDGNCYVMSLSISSVLQCPAWGAQSPDVRNHTTAGTTAGSTTSGGVVMAILSMSASLDLHGVHATSPTVQEDRSGRACVTSTTDACAGGET